MHLTLKVNRATECLTKISPLDSVFNADLALVGQYFNRIGLDALVNLPHLGVCIVLNIVALHHAEFRVKTQKNRSPVIN